jgi:hypothetical protein
MTPATCHPRRQHHARGLCKACYRATLDAAPPRKEARQRRAREVRLFDSARRGLAALDRACVALGMGRLALMAALESGARTPATARANAVGWASATPPGLVAPVTVTTGGSRV